MINTRILQRPRSLSILAAAVLAASGALHGQAAVSTWLGNNADWHDANQWSPVGVPTGTQFDPATAIINAGNANVAFNTTINRLELGPLGTVTLLPGSTLAISNSNNFDAGVALGTFVLNNNATLDIRNQYLLSNTAVTGTGKVRIGTNERREVTVQGNVGISNLLLTSDEYQTAYRGEVILAGNLTVGTLTWEGGNFLANPNGATGTVIVTGTASVIDLPANNSKVMRAPVVLQGNSTIESSIAVENTLTNNGTLTLRSGLAASAQGQLVNNGTLNLVGSGYVAPWLINAPTAVINVNPGIVYPFGSMAINGEISGTVNIPLYQKLRYARVTLNEGAQILGDGVLEAAGANDMPFSSKNLTVAGNAYVQNVVLNPNFVTALDGPGNLHITGTGSWTHGAIKAALTIEPGAVFTASAVTPKIDAAIVTNWGTYHMETSTELANNAVLVNRVVMNMKGGINELLVPSNSGMLINAGLINVLGNGSSNDIRYIHVPFDNTGTLATLSGSMHLYGGGTSSGTFTTGNGLSINIEKPYTLGEGAKLNGWVRVKNTVTLAGNVDASGTFLESFIGNALTGPGTLNATGTVYWFSGTIAGTGALNVKDNGSLQIHTGTDLLLDNRSLTNGGKIIWGPIPGYASGYDKVLTVNNATITNNNDFRARSDNRMAAGVDGASFINNGLFLKQDGSVFTSPFSPKTQIDLPFHNAGQVEVMKGHLHLAGGGTSTGSFKTPAGTGLTLINHTLQDATLTGTGLITGSVTLMGNVSAESAAFGAIGGTGNLDVSKTLRLANSAITTTGTVTLLHAGTLEVDILRSPVPTLGHRINAATLISNGKTRFADVQGNDYSSVILMTLENNAAFTSNGALEFKSPATFNGDGSPGVAVYNNASLTVATTSNGSFVTFNVPFHNTGSVGLASGNIDLNGGGSSTGGTLGVGTGNRIRINAPFTVNGGTLGTASYTGSVQLNHALTIAGHVLAHNLVIGQVTSTSAPINAAVKGNGMLTASGAWYSGAISNTDGLVVGNGIANTNLNYATFVIYNNGPKTLDGADLTIPANRFAAWTSGRSYVQPGSQITLRNGAQIHNHGTFYTHTGSPAFVSGDTHAGNAFYNYGTFGRFASWNYSGTTRMALPFHNTGLVDIQTGYIDFAGGYFDNDGTPGSAGDFLFAPNSGLAFSGGVYDFSGGVFDLGPGGLKGTGTVKGNFLLGGTLAPGTSPGLLTFDGDLALAAAAVAQMEIGIADPAALWFDQVAVAGTLTLDGTLELIMLPGATPNPADTLTLFSADELLGSFDNVASGQRLATTDGLWTYAVYYGATSPFDPDSVVIANGAPIPEPASLALLGAGVMGLLRRRQAVRR